MPKREQGRVLAVQALYQWDLRGEDFAKLVDDFLAESTQDSEVYFFARELTFGAWNFHDESDRLIKEAAAHWDMQRMAAVDRNILRLAIYEMLGRSDIPPHVAIDQAIELAKRFGSGESGAFVNGILDHVLRAAGPAPAAAPGEGAAAGAGGGAALGGAAPEVPNSKQYPDLKEWDDE